MTNRLNDRLVIAIVIVAVLAAACGSFAYNRLNQPVAQSRTQLESTTIPTTPYLGVCELDLKNFPKVSLEPGGEIRNAKASTFLVLENVGERASIVLPGDGSCLYITGTVGAHAFIYVSGLKSSVVFRGAIDPTANIEISEHALEYREKKG